MTLGINTLMLGHKFIEYRIDFDYANSIIITLHANIIAPIISVSESWLDYGLIQTYSLESRELKITNHSSITAIV